MAKMQIFVLLVFFGTVLLDTATAKDINAVVKYKPFRDDGRCGANFPAPNGNPAQCTAPTPCCNQQGYCGNTPKDCLCKGCKDYTLVPAPHGREFGTGIEKRGAAAAAAGMAVGAAVVAGATLAGVALLSLIRPYSYVLGIEINNWSEYALVDPIAHIDRGEVSIAPTTILPGQKEAIVAHKSLGFHGTRGAVTWRVAGTRFYITVMWSVPFNRFFYSNYMALGVTDQDHWAKSKNLFRQMFHTYGPFIRQKYRRSSRTIRYPTTFRAELPVSIEGAMPTSKKGTMKLIVKPTNTRHLAPKLRAVRKSICERITGSKYGYRKNVPMLNGQIQC